MLTAVIAGALVALSVWLIVPATSLARLGALHGGHVPDGDLVQRLLHRRASDQPSAPERLAVGLRTLAAELRAGCTPIEALERAAGSPPLWPKALAAARFGEPVDVGLLHDARLSKELAGQLRQLAACWQVGVIRGSGLALSVERLALSLRSQRELHATLRSELSAPRATSRMLALLPVIGVLMGYLLGADPISWFLGSTAGLMVLAIAVLLTVIGTVWTRRIVSNVERGLV